MKKIVFLIITLTMILLSACKDSQNGAYELTTTTTATTTKTIITTTSTIPKATVSLTTTQTTSIPVKDDDAVGHTHKFYEATCTEAERCWLCKATRKPALGHKYRAATCTTAKKCTRCGQTVGNPLGHNYHSGECTRCGERDDNYIEKLSIQDTWVVDGKFEFKIKSVVKHYACNDYSNKIDGLTGREPVIIIEYWYKNIGSSSEVHIFDVSGNFVVYDEQGEAGDTYPCTHDKFPASCIIGTASSGSRAFMLPNDSTSVVFRVSYLGGKAAFELEL